MTRLSVKKGTVAEQDGKSDSVTLAHGVLFMIYKLSDLVVLSIHFRSEMSCPGGVFGQERG